MERSKKHHILDRTISWDVYGDCFVAEQSQFPYMEGSYIYVEYVIADSLEPG